MFKMFNILTVLSVLLVAQNTVEDLRATSVVPHLSPSVIDMSIPSGSIEAEKGVSSTTEKAQSIAQQNSQAIVEQVNGIMRTKVKRSKTPKITKLDKEAKKVKGLEPAGLSSF